MKTRVIAAAATLGVAVALFPVASASATDKVLVCHKDDDGGSLLSLPSAAVEKQGHANHEGDTIEGSVIGEITITAADVRKACGETEPAPSSTVTVTATVTKDVPGPTVTETITKDVPGPTVTDTVTSTVTDKVPGPTVTDTVTDTVTKNVPGPVTTVAGPVSTVTVAGAASTVTKTVAAAGVAATEAGPSKRLAHTGTSAWEPVGLGAGLLLAGLLLLLGRRTLATERRH